MSRLAAEHILEHIDIGSTDQVLDLACGTGIMTRQTIARETCEALAVFKDGDDFANPMKNFLVQARKN